MARKVDITEKLSFGENPCLIIKGKELEVNSDAPTMLKVLGLMSEGDPGVKEIMAVYNLIFPKKSREEIEKGLKLSFNDLVTIVQEAIQLITDAGDSRGE